MPFETRAQFEARVRAKQDEQTRAIARGLAIFGVIALFLAALVALFT